MSWSVTLSQNLYRVVLKTFAPQSLEICLSCDLPSIWRIAFCWYFYFFRLIDQLWVHLSFSLNNDISNVEETNGQMVRVSWVFNRVASIQISSAARASLFVMFVKLLCEETKFLNHPLYFKVLSAEIFALD